MRASELLLRAVPALAPPLVRALFSHTSMRYVNPHILKDWVYVLTTDATPASQLYMTKDAGAHWTRVRVPIAQLATNTSAKQWQQLAKRTAVGALHDARAYMHYATARA